MSTIFISHSSQDNETAREIKRRLALQGHHSVFLDIDPEKGIVGGQSWESTLYRKLRACQAVIALCTNHYLDSHWCFAEIALARMEGKHIIALQADPLDDQAKMPAILTERQFIDLRRDGDEVDQRMREALKALDKPVGPDLEPNESPYLGLSAYQEKHASVFFGREEESRAGIELLDRGAPGLIMVLGASGSGKSSLVRAGILPRLRSRKDEWLIVDPFRPGRDPLAELTESLVQSYRRYAPEHAGEAGRRERIRERLLAGPPGPSISAPPAADESDEPEQMQDDAEDERLRRLMELLERLHEDPPPLLAGRLQDYLEWSLDDLRRICGQQAAVVSSPKFVSQYKTPLIEIAHDLRRVSRLGGARVLLVIDQFEELLYRKKTDEEASSFLALLRASIEADHSPLMVLGTMRSDFLGLFQRNIALRGIDFESLSLGPMKIEGMRRVIEEPAKLAAIELESGLADRLLEDTETPDALPLLSFTLEVLWRKHHGDNKFEIADYENLGGLQGAITGEADAVLKSARLKHQEDDLRKALIQMARLSEDGRYARRPVSWDAPEIHRIEPILKKLIERRILVSRMEGERRIVEVAHEALFRAWKPLRAWLDNARSELLFKQQLERDAKTWQENNRAATILWRGGRLLQARDLMGKQNLRVAARKGSLMAEFVRAGLRRRLRLGATTIAITVFGIAVLAGFAVVARNERNAARHQRDIALSRQVATHAEDALEKVDYQLGLLLAAEALQRKETREAREVLKASLESTSLLERTLWVPASRLPSLAFSPDGSRLAVYHQQNQVEAFLTIFNVSNGKEISTQVFAAGIRSLAWGEQLVGIRQDERGKYSLLLFDKEGRAKRFPLPQKGCHEVRDVGADVDGTITIACYSQLFRGTKKNERWEGTPIKGVRGGSPKALSGNGRHALFGGIPSLWHDGDHQVTPLQLETMNGAKIRWNGRPAINGSGQRIAASTAKGTLVWALDGPSVPLAVLPRSSQNLTFSPDGHRLANTYLDGRIEIWEVGTVQPLSQPLAAQRRDDKVMALALSPDRSHLAAGTRSGFLTLQNLWGDDSAARVLSGWRGSIRAPLYLPSQPGNIGSAMDSLVIVEEGNYLVARRVLSRELFGKAVLSEGRFLAASASHDGMVHAMVTTKEKVRILNLTTGASIDLDLPKEPVDDPQKDRKEAGAFSIDGRFAAFVDVNDHLWFLDMIRKVRKDIQLEQQESLNAWNSMLAVAEIDNGAVVIGYGGQLTKHAVYLWSPHNGSVTTLWIGSPRYDDLLDVDISTDGERISIILGALRKDQLLLWQMVGQEWQERTVKVKGNEIAFGIGGNSIAVGWGRVSLVDFSSSQVRKLEGGLSGVPMLTFDTDGQYLTAATDRDVRIWDLETGKSVSASENYLTDGVEVLTFEDSGRRITAASRHGAVVGWSLDGSAPTQINSEGKNDRPQSIPCRPQKSDSDTATLDLSLGVELEPCTAMTDADGQSLQVGMLGTWAVLWELPSGDWIERACRQAGRNFSAEEWVQYVGESVDYRETCPGYPRPKEN